MKTKAFILSSLLLTITLTSCRISFLESEKGEMDVCSLIGGKVDSSRKVNYRYLNKQELLPYFSMKEYTSLIKNHMKNQFELTINETGGESTVFVQSEEGNIFIASISTSSQSLIAYGDFSNAMTFDKDYSKSSLYLSSSTTYENVKEPTNVRTFSYRDMGFTTFAKNGTTYYPLSLLECVFAPSCGLHHYYNYCRLVEYAEYEELTDTSYEADGSSVTAFKEQKQYIAKNMPDMPMYLRKDRLASFLFTLENQYGLKYTRKISSMRKYLAKQSFYSDFLSENNLLRNEAYYKTFALLDDGHTSIRDHYDFPWKEGSFNPYGPKMSRILSVRQNLSSQRDLVPGDVYFSTDGKMAFFTFDSFTFIQNAYEEDGTTICEGLSDYHSTNYDTFFYMSKCLQDIKNKTGVEKVVIDISTNGGGTLGVMNELITLLSKDNKSTTYVQQDVLDVVQSMTTKVDTNNDKIYDSNDVFGNDFDFYILTSEFSFSCGNAFPFYLKKHGFAKIIGQKSGGGECAVSEAYLPSGEHFYHSSNIHIGWYNDSYFEGDEPGVDVDIEIDYKDFYNLDKLQQLIK